MPRKTKKRKTKAAKRRRHNFEFENRQTELVKREFSFTELEGFEPAKAETASKNPVKSYFSQPLKPVYKDLAKSAVIAGIILGVELVVYSFWFK